MPTRQEIQRSTLEEQHDRRTNRLTLSLVLGIGALTILVLIFVDHLNTASIFGFPLGYFFAAAAIPLISVLMAFWGAVAQESIDQSFNLNEDQ